MPIATACTECGRAYNLADKLAGKKIKCKDCGAIMRVPGGEDKPKKEKKEKKEKPKSAVGSLPPLEQEDYENIMTSITTARGNHLVHIKNLLKSYTVTCEQSAALVKEVIQDGVKVACLLHPSIVDPANFEIVLRELKWEEERQEVIEKLGLDDVSKAIREEEENAKNAKEAQRLAELEANKQKFAAGGEKNQGV